MYNSSSHHLPLPGTPLQLLLLLLMLVVVVMVAGFEGIHIHQRGGGQVVAEEPGGQRVVARAQRCGVVLTPVAHTRLLRRQLQGCVPGGTVQRLRRWQVQRQVMGPGVLVSVLHRCWNLQHEAHCCYYHLRMCSARHTVITVAV